jgi:hypothetical protein
VGDGIGAGAVDDRGDLLGVDVVTAEDLGDLTAAHQGEGAQLVGDAALAGVAEGRMPKIMEQCGDSYETRIATPAVSRQGVAELTRHVARPERVDKTAVLRAGVHEVRQPELAHTS